MRALRRRPLRWAGRSRSALVACLAALASLHCGEARERTNLEIFQEHAEHAAPAEGRTEEEEAIARFRNVVWLKRQPVFRNRFLGVSTLQNPLDAWIIQEIICEVAPDFIVETGTYHGGSAALWALLLEQVNPQGRVITIDIEDQREPAAIALSISQRRVDFLLGSSTDPAIVAEVERRVRGKVLVILDSLHSKEHVAGELRAYAPLVSVGSYVIVQDTPVGPIDAIDEFLATDGRFEADRDRERFGLTNTVRGYLRRIR
jgi:cephalosporin hydroxylase